MKFTAGFTLIEVLVTSGILFFVVFVVVVFGSDILNFQIFLGDTFTAQQEINLTLASMGIEVRGMGPSANGSYAIESASPASLVFYSDIDGDNAFERVRYFVSGAVLQRGVTEPTGNPATYPAGSESIKDLVSNVILPPTASQSLFLYYGKNYTGTQVALPAPIDVNKIRLIKVTITADRMPQDVKSRLEYFSMIMIRNLRNVP